MTTNHKIELETRAAELQHQTEQVDLPTLEQAVADAKVSAGYWAERAPDEMLRRNEQQALLRLSAAENELSSARSRVAHLQDELRPLERMLTGAARTAEAQPLVDAAVEHVTAVQAQVEQARQTVDRLGEQLADAQTAHAAAEHAAARDLLEAARYGTPAAGAPDAATAERARVVTIERALALARDELVQAEQAHSTATGQLEAAREVLRSAQCDAARLDLELALHELAPEVVRYQRLGGRDRIDDVLQRAVRTAERAH